MSNFLQSIVQKSAAVIAASIAAVVGVVTQPNTVVVNPPPPILVLPAPTSTASLIESTATSSATSSTNTIIVNKPATSTTKTTPLPSANPPKTIKSQPTSPALKIFTAQQILDRTSFSLGQQLDGKYRLLFRTDIGSSSGFDWNLSDAIIGGTTSVPKMNTSFSCDPQWNPPSADSEDQSPTFSIDTSYTCIVSLTDAPGRATSRQFTFRTGKGRLLIKSSNLDTTLKGGNNMNGFVFDNQSDEVLTVNELFFDVSFAAISPLNPLSSLVLRFVNPENESLFVDFPVQDLAADPVRADFKTGSNMKVPLLFSIKPHSQRLLAVDVLNVKQLMTAGINPEFDVTLRQINTDHPEVKTMLFSPAISWTCFPYDSSRSQGPPNEQNCQ